MITIGILLFPNVEEMDFIGPFEVLSYINKLKPDSTRICLLAPNSAPIVCANGLRVLPDMAIAAAPNFDVLVVPGGQGRRQAMHQPEMLQFIRQQAATATYVTSVCTGAFLLAEAGLLTGKKATTYHAARAELAAYPNISVETKKVVQDGAVITAAGVTSGLELGFHLLQELFSPALAQEVARKIEYKLQS